MVFEVGKSYKLKKFEDCINDGAKLAISCSMHKYFGTEVKVRKIDLDGCLCCDGGWWFAPSWFNVKKVVNK